MLVEGLGDEVLEPLDGTRPPRRAAYGEAFEPVVPMPVTLGRHGSRGAARGAGRARSASPSPPRRQPLVVLAPAGSGKTRVLTRRIAYRVAIGASDPRHVLALTFTRKAAGELTDRLGRLGLRGDATAGTFHAVAWGSLRTRWADQGRTPPTLLDRKGRRAGRGRARRSAAASGRSPVAEPGHGDRVGQGPDGHPGRLRRRPWWPPGADRP